MPKTEPTLMTAMAQPARTSAGGCGEVGGGVGGGGVGGGGVGGGEGGNDGGGGDGGGGNDVHTEPRVDVNASMPRPRRSIFDLQTGEQST